MGYVTALYIDLITSIKNMQFRKAKNKLNVAILNKIGYYIICFIERSIKAIFLKII